MLVRLRHAAEEGIVLGVKFGIPLLIIGWLILWAVGDYARVRQQSQQGQTAYQYLEWAVQQGALPAANQAPTAAQTPPPPTQEP